MLHFLYIKGRAVLIAISAKLLDTKCKFYGFINDLTEILTNEYHCYKVDFSRKKQASLLLLLLNFGVGKRKSQLVTNIKL